ncbi:MAG: TolC family protein [Bacteroidales bacterium]
MIIRLFIAVFFAVFVTFTLKAQQEVTLEQCKELALENNHAIKFAKEQVGAANALTKSARTGYFPNFSANALYMRTNRQINLLENDLFIPSVPFSSIDPETNQFDPNRDPENTFVLHPFTDEIIYDSDGNPIFQNYAWLPKDQLNFGAKNMFAGGVTVVQPIYTGGKIKEMHRISQHTEKLARANLSKEESEVLFKTEESYWRVVSLQEKVSMAQSYKKLLEELNDDLNNLYEEGIVIRNDLLQVKVKLNEAKLNLLKAKNGLSLSRMALCQLTGLPLGSDIILTDSLNVAVKPLPDRAYVDSAFAHRPELESLNQALNIAESGVNLMKSRYMPNVGLTAGYMMLNPNPYKGFSESFGGDWNVSIAVNIPIFHWNDKAHSLRAARHEKRAAEIKMTETKELISLEVQQAIYSANEVAKKVMMAEESLELAKENLDVANDTFEEGMIKTTDVLEAQALWQSALSDLIEARMEYKLSQVKLRRVSGSLIN